MSIKIIKFALVGFINNICNYLAVIISNKLFRFNVFYSGSIGFLIGAIIAFILNSKFTFKYRNISKKTIIYFFLVQFFILFLFSTLITIFEFYSKSISISWIISTSIIFILNFFLQSKLVFRN